MFFSNLNLFILIISILYVAYILIIFGVKIYGRFVMGDETVILLTSHEKIILWFSLGFIIQNIFK